MTCEHKRSTVFNSRRPDSVNQAGNRHWGERDYKPLVFRRRRCFDCGLAFTTVEVELKIADGLAARNETVIRKELAKQVSDFLLRPTEREPNHG